MYNMLARYDIFHGYLRVYSPLGSCKLSSREERQYREREKTKDKRDPTRRGSTNNFVYSRQADKI